MNINYLILALLALLSTVANAVRWFVIDRDFKISSFAVLFIHIFALLLFVFLGFQE